MKNYLRRIEMNNNYKNMIEKIMKNKHIQSKEIGKKKKEKSEKKEI